MVTLSCSLLHFASAFMTYPDIPLVNDPSRNRIERKNSRSRVFFPCLFVLYLSFNLCLCFLFDCSSTSIYLLESCFRPFSDILCQLLIKFLGTVIKGLGPISVAVFCSKESVSQFGEKISTPRYQLRRYQLIHVRPVVSFMLGE